MKTIGKIGGAALTVGSLFSKGLFKGSFSWWGLGLLGVNMLLSSSQTSEGQRLEDLGVQTAQEGAPLPRGWGDWRQGGNIAWSTGLIEHSQSSRQGGKGGPKTVEYSYTTSIAIEMGRGPITRIKSLELNGKVKYTWNEDGESGATLAYDDTNGMWYSTSIEDGWCSAIRIYDGTQAQPDSALEANLGTGKATCFPGQWYIVIDDLQLSEFGNSVPNVTAQPYYEETRLTAIITEICGWANLTADDLDLTALEGRTIVTAISGTPAITGRIATSQGFGLYPVTVTLKQGSATIATTTTNANGEYSFSGVADGDYTVVPSYTGLSFVPESRDVSMPDAASSAFVAYISGTVAPGINNEIPDIAPPTVGFTGEGYVVDTRKPAHEAIAPLLFLHGFRMPEVDGVLRAAPGGGTVVDVLAESDLRIHTPDGDTPETEQRDADPDTVPDIFEIQYWDINRKYHPGYRYGRRQGSVARRRASTTVPAALDGPHAEQIVKARLHEAQFKAQTHTLSLGLKHLWLSAGDVIQIPTASGDKAVYLPDLTAALFGPITTTAPLSDSSVYSAPRPTGTAGSGFNTTKPLGELTGLLWEMHAPLDTNLDTPQLYAAAAVPYGAGWSPVTLTPAIAGIHAGNSSGSNYPTFGSSAAIGYVVGTLADFDGGSVAWDDDTTLRVAFLSGAPESATDAALLTENANALYVGNQHEGEILQFGVATYVETDGDGRKVYDLSRLLRGRRGTEPFIGTHGTDEFVVLLNSALVRIDVNLSALDRSVEWRWGRNGEQVATQEFIVTGRSLKPYSVGGVTSERGESGNITATFWPRTRYVDTYMNGGPAPLLTAAPDTDNYEIDVMDGATVKRTLTVSGPGPGVSFEYSAVQQAADFGSAQSSVTVRIYRLSAVATSISPNGRGYVREVTL